jgi:large subunit ribosomal protein L15
MRLNKLKPAVGAKKVRVRVGRGCGSGMGKTCGRGHKGQTARSGYSKKIGFEGGQLPLQRRVPKFGFTSLEARKIAEVRLHELQKMKGDRIGVAELKAANFINNEIEKVRIILSGKITKPVTIYGNNIAVTAGARRAIEACGGKIE